MQNAQDASGPDPGWFDASRSSFTFADGRSTRLVACTSPLLDLDLMSGLWHPAVCNLASSCFHVRMFVCVGVHLLLLAKLDRSPISGPSVRIECRSGTHRGSPIGALPFLARLFGLCLWILPQRICRASIDKAKGTLSRGQWERGATLTA